MRRGGHLLPGRVPDREDAGGNVPAVRLHDFQKIAHRKLVFLVKRDPAVAVRRLRESEVGASGHVGAALVNLFLRAGLPEIEAGRERPGRAGRDLPQVPGDPAPVKLRIFLKIRHRHPVRPRAGRDVERRLHAALDLKAVDARRVKLRQMPDHAEILRIK